MLKEITLKFTESSDLQIPADGITVFVGSNGSGKSLLLRELNNVLAEVNHLPQMSLIKDFDILWPTETELIERIEKHRMFGLEQTDDDQIKLGMIEPSGNIQRVGVQRSQIPELLKNKRKDWYAKDILRPGTLRLDGRTRFDLSNDQNVNDILAAARTSFAYILKEEKEREALRKLIFEGTGRYLIIDPSNLGKLRLRLSTTKPSGDELSLGPENRKFLEKAIYIKNASDGLQAYVGILTTAYCGGFDVLLVDEPEVFLHPPLVETLGRQLAKLASARKSAMLAATHSADFLVGCVQGASNVRVVRLEYRDGKSRGRLVDHEELKALLTKPLMRSANVISGLFYDGVVATESDNDRVFYAEIYYRLKQVNSNLPSVLFVNAQNKQTMRDIIGPMRKFGVPVAAIPDIDFVKDGGTNTTQWMKAAQIPLAEHIGLNQTRSSIKGLFEKTGKDMKLEGGIDLLQGDEREAAENYFHRISDYGVFVVPGGELESWLPSLGVPGKGTDWTLAMLEKLGDDPTSSDYIRPADDDVWQFLRSVLDWISDPSRKGVK